MSILDILKGRVLCSFKSSSLLSPTIKSPNLFIKFEIIATVIKYLFIYCDLMNSHMKVNV